jgi:hypothetical protein
MSSKTMSLVGALGLLASGANAATLHSADAVSAPRSTVADASSAKVKLVTSTTSPKAGCFVAMVNGRMPKLSEIRKAKASSACASNHLAQAGGAAGAAGGAGGGIGGALGGVLPGALISAGVGAGVAYGVSEANKQDLSPGGNS